MKNILKLISISSLVFILAGCSSQKQNEGGSNVQNEGGSKSAGVGSTHKHQMPDGSDRTHSHDGNLSKTHTHKLSEM